MVVLVRGEGGAWAGCVLVGWAGWLWWLVVMVGALVGGAGWVCWLDGLVVCWLVVLAGVWLVGSG